MAHKMQQSYHSIDAPEVLWRVDKYDRSSATEQIDMQTTTSRYINKQNQADESSPNEQIITLTEPAPYQHQPY